MKPELPRLLAALAVLGSLAACAPDAPPPAAPRPAAPDPNAPWPATGRCYLDKINETLGPAVTVERGAQARFSGWMSNAAAEVPTDARLVLSGAGGRHEFPLSGGVSRPDVAKAFAREALANAGFTLAVDLAGVAPGTYELAIETGEPAARCALRPKLVVAE